MHRIVMLDTETTGFNPDEGHRVVEIGAVEYIDRQKTGNVFHHYLDPERSVPSESTAIHGLTDDFLSYQPRFADVAREFCKFIQYAEVVAHNVQFDARFLDAEIKRVVDEVNPRRQAPTIATLADRVTDSLSIARKVYPGQKNSLDALCDRLKISRDHRDMHGALIDAELLGDVYMALTHEQWCLNYDDSSPADTTTASGQRQRLKLAYPSTSEAAAHRAHCEAVGKSCGKRLWPFGRGQAAAGASSLASRARSANRVNALVALDRGTEAAPSSRGPAPNMSHLI